MSDPFFGVRQILCHHFSTFWNCAHLVTSCQLIRTPWGDIRSCVILVCLWQVLCHHFQNMWELREGSHLVMSAHVWPFLGFGKSCCIIWKHVGVARTLCQLRRIRFSDVRSCVICFVFSQFLCHQSKTCHTKNQKHKTVSTTSMSSEWHILYLYIIPRYC